MSLHQGRGFCFMFAVSFDSAKDDAKVSAGQEGGSVREAGACHLDIVDLIIAEVKTTCLIVIDLEIIELRIILYQKELSLLDFWNPIIVFALRLSKILSTMTVFDFTCKKVKYPQFCQDFDSPIRYMA
jgi:hypothetical protein